MEFGRQNGRHSSKPLDSYRRSNAEKTYHPYNRNSLDLYRSRERSWQQCEGHVRPSAARGDVPSASSSDSIFCQFHIQCTEFDFNFKPNVRRKRFRSNSKIVLKFERIGLSAIFLWSI